MTRITFVAVLWFCCACGDSSYNVIVRPPPGLPADVEIEVSLLSRCSDEPAPEDVLATQIVGGGEGIPFGDFDAGRYGLFARASNASCGVIARGCENVDLQSGGTGDLLVVLDRVSACSESDAGTDAGADGSVDAFDAGFDAPDVPDASLPDVAEDVFDAGPPLCTECAEAAALPELGPVGVCTRGAYACPFDPVVVHVTSLADTGPGSLRAALMMTAPRVVVFDVSGNIPLMTPIQFGFEQRCLTVAGQTAPGPVVIVGAVEGDATNDIVFEHITIQGFAGQPTLRFSGSQRVALDHLTLTYGNPISLELGTSTEASLTRSIVLPVLNGPAANREAYAAGSSGDSLFYRNVFALHSQRAPFVSGSSRIYNNYMFGSSFRNIQLIEGIRAAVVGNHILSSSDEGPPSASPILGVGDNWSGSQVYENNNTLVGFVPLVGNIPAMALVDSDPFGPSCELEPLTFEAITEGAGARPGARSSLATAIVADVLLGRGNTLARAEDGPGYPLVPEMTLAAEVPDDPHEVLPSGQTRLEEWLRAEAAAVE